MTPEQRRNTIETLLDGSGYSCVIFNNGHTTVCHSRGVKDLYRLLTEYPDTLRGAFVADKVIGKGAAALMILGGVAEAYTPLISRPALELFNKAGIAVEYGECVPNIINRTRTGICPVEKLCADCQDAESCLPLIKNFISTLPIV